MGTRLLVVGSLTAVSLAAQNGYWAQLAFPAAPTARYGSALVYDSSRDRLVLIGGLPGVLNQTWENDGATWTLRTTTGPTGSAIWYPTAYLRAVYDSQRQCTVAVRADAASGNTQTWEWNGTAWQQRTNSSVPPGRAGFGLAYDSVRGRTVLFGGMSGGVDSADTWEWDGATWLQRGSGGPSPRQLPMMAFDSVRGRTVLYGGWMTSTPYTTFGDTWEWNGQYWMQYFGVGGPGPRTANAMAFDSVRGVTVLYGGYSGPGVGGPTNSDTWEWNGIQWINRQAGNPATVWTALAYDSSRRRTVLFGGQDQFGQTLNQTWAYTATGQSASLAPYGAGCAGPTGVPLLSAVGGSLPRLGTTLYLQLSNMPTGPLNIPVAWLGFDNSTWSGLPLPLALDPFGFPGCTALLAPAATYSLTNGAGTASWSLAIPFLPAFAGLPFYLQGGVLVLGFNPGGFVFTRGLAGVVGT